MGMASLGAIPIFFLWPRAVGFGAVGLKRWRAREAR